MRALLALLILTKFILGTCHTKERSFIKRELQPNFIISQLKIPGFDAQENRLLEGLSQCRVLMNRKCSAAMDNGMAVLCDNRKEEDVFVTNVDREPIADMDGIRRMVKFYYCADKNDPPYEAHELEAKEDSKNTAGEELPTTHDMFQKGLQKDTFEGQLKEKQEDESFHRHCSETERPQVICLEQHLIEKPERVACNCWYRDGFSFLID